MPRTLSSAPWSQAAEPGASTGQIGRALAVLESVAENGSSTAREISDGTGIPVPTVYRIAHELMRADYLVHLRSEGRFALGYRLHWLAVGLHTDLGVPTEVRRQIEALRDDLGMASYLAIQRGTDVVVVHVADGVDCPRLQPMGFGFHEHPHATAFGKLALASLDAAARERYLDRPLTALTRQTITDHERLRHELDAVAHQGVAWEHGEFQDGSECLAAPIRAGDGTLLGSVAVSTRIGGFAGRARHVEDRVRASAIRAARFYRLGSGLA